MNLPGEPLALFYKYLFLLMKRSWHDLCNATGGPTLGRAGGPPPMTVPPWECGALVTGLRGSKADGECPPDRTVATDRAQSRARSRGQQHRQPRHHRLQE